MVLAMENNLKVRRLKVTGADSILVKFFGSQNAYVREQRDKYQAKYQATMPIR